MYKKLEMVMIEGCHKHHRHQSPIHILQFHHLGQNFGRHQRKLLKVLCLVWVFQYINNTTISSSSIVIVCYLQDNIIIPRILINKGISSSNRIINTIAIKVPFIFYNFTIWVRTLGGIKGNF